MQDYSEVYNRQKLNNKYLDYSTTRGCGSHLRRPNTVSLLSKVTALVDMDLADR